MLDMMEAAIRRRIPVVMFGQGMGPLSDPIVLSRARDVLPRITLITLRGGRGGLQLLESIGSQSSERADDRRRSDRACLRGAR